MNNLKNSISIKHIIFVGVLLLLMSVVMQVFSTKAEQNLSEGFYTPIIAFEFIQNQSQVLKFLDVHQPEEYIKKMLLGNRLDYLFMIIYSVFLFLVSYYTYDKTKHKYFILALILSPIALLTDALENFQIFYILKNSQSDLSLFLHDLRLYTWIKWIVLAIIFLLFGVYFLKQKKIILGIIAIFPIIIAPIAFLSYNTINEIFVLSIILNFLTLFIYVLLEYKNTKKVYSN